MQKHLPVVVVVLVLLMILTMIGIGSGTGPRDWLKILFPPQMVATFTEEEQLVRNAQLLQLLGNPELLRLGQHLYQQYCRVCHQSPSALNHPGVTPMQIEWAIRHGDLSEGMPAWQSVFNEEQIVAVTVYVLSASD